MPSFTLFWILTAVSETRSLSPTFEEERGAGASSIAGPATTVEHSLECSILPADGISPNRGFAALGETLVRVSTLHETAKHSDLPIGSNIGEQET